MNRATRMNKTETRVVTPRQQKKNAYVSDFRTVQWIQNVGVVKRSYEYSAEIYHSAKGFSTSLAWILGYIEMVFISIYLFIHSLPWPDCVMNIILKLDRVIESLLEAISNKLEWWWDNVMVRLMRFRDTIESLIDTFLSLCLFVVYKSIQLWMRSVSVTVVVLKFVFAPLIWAVTTIFPLPQKDSNSSPVSHPLPPPTITIRSAHNSSTDPDSKVNANGPGVEAEETSHLSGTTSDCESEVSVVSESWTIRQTDQSGKLYNRVEMKATAEGRLRAAMYKRVKTQLSIMRSNSVNFSRGMTSYARQYLEPKVIPVISVLKEKVRATASKYGIVDTFDKMSAWVDRHYYISSVASFGISFVMVPVTLANRILLGSKKKSRRTRSMRSESLRRRSLAPSATVVTPPTLESLGLIKSEEPVVIEESEFCNFRKYKMPRKGSSDDSMKDSALASSLDDLCHISDSTDGSNSFRDQTIHEEENKSQKYPKTMLGNLEVPPVLRQTQNGDIMSNGPRSCMVNSTREPRRRRTDGIIMPTKNTDGSLNELYAKLSEMKRDNEPDSNRINENGDPWIISRILSMESKLTDIRKEICPHETKETKVEEPETVHSDESDKKAKPQRRKISFSFDC